MKIGLDAKRIFNNPTGLGVYGRNLIKGFDQIQSSHEFHLFTPQSHSTLFNVGDYSIKLNIQSPEKKNAYFWRTFNIKKDIAKCQLDIYHGLSNELPMGIQKLKVKSIVDIHDLCFVNFPKDYHYLDQKIFLYKTKQAAKHSDRIIATSLATKKDIIQYLNCAENKIDVVYQSCDPVFFKKANNDNLQRVKDKFDLPQQFILTVGTIQGRKNQQAIVQALALLPKNKRIPLVLVGKGGDFLKELIQLAQEKNVIIHVLQNVSFTDLPMVYQLAKLFVYPSHTEGFGIPVLEAMASQIPVITSENTSMAEIIQDEDCLINSTNVESLSEKISWFLTSNVKDKVEANYLRAKMFSSKNFASNVQNIYESL